MKKSELLETLSKIGIHPGKKLGQNFLIDGNLLDFIARQAAPHENEIILEVGPGAGALTRKLLGSGAIVIAIEADGRLYEFLRETMASPYFHPVHADACKCDIGSLLREVREKSQIPPSAGWRTVANLPYSISTPFIAGLLRLPEPPRSMLFMLQRETAHRFASKPGTHEYNAVSVASQILYKVEIVRNVPPEVFHPVPEVESAIVSFSLRDSAHSGNIAETASFVRMAFSHRRKKLINNLSILADHNKLTRVFEQLGLSQNTRAEELSPEKYLELEKLVKAKRSEDAMTSQIK